MAQLRPWWQRGVIYQIAVPSFADSDADGMGDLPGVLGRLDYLRGTAESLGVNAIWLTPIHASPMRDFGYDVADYRALNPRLGSIDDLRDLLRASHDRGLRVLMDLALNHTSDEHPWFVESRSSRTNPKREWYVWRDGRAPGKPPNRWRAAVEGSAWQYDATTEQYYYHAFLPFQPDLNWRNPAVRAELFDVVRYWLEEGVDGFRLDLVNFLFEDELLRDNPFKLGLRPYLAQHHLHDFSQPESIETVRQLRDIVNEYPERALLGEIFSDRPGDTIAFLGDGTDALHLAFYVDFIRQPWRARDFRRSVDWLESRLPVRAWPCYYLNNHDLPRSHSRLGTRAHGDARARVAAAMLLTLRGTPILYYGEELGMPTSDIPREAMDDPIGRKFWPFRVGRDGARTPMHWSAESNAGFTDGTPWMPVDPSYSQRNVAAQSTDERSLLSWYRRLIALRSATPALHSGSYRGVDSHRDVFAYVREAEGQSVGVALNFAARPRPLPRAFQGWSALLSTHAEPVGALGAYEARIMASRNGLG
jgi:alpha-glucosidase